MSSHSSTPVTIAADDLNKKFDDVLDRAHSGQEHFIVEKDGQPVVAIISMTEYQELLHEKSEREERLRQFRRAAHTFGEALARQDLSEDTGLAQLEESRQQVYDRHYGKRPSR